MKLKKAVLAFGVCGILGGAYEWQSHDAAVSTPGSEAEAHADLNDPKNKAVAEMARFLEAAPRDQLSAMIKTNASTPVAVPSWNKLLPFTQKTESGAWIAQMLAQDEPLGTSEEARAKLLENPARSAEDIQTVLGELPEQYEDQRADLLAFEAKLARHVENNAQVADLFLAEAQRSVAQAHPGAREVMPQAIALREYYRLVSDPAKQLAAYKAAVEGQTDPEVRAVLERIEAPSAPRTPAAVQASSPTAVSAPGTEVAVSHPQEAAPEAQDLKAAVTQETPDTSDREPAAQVNPGADPVAPPAAGETEPVRASEDRPSDVH